MRRVLGRLWRIIKVRYSEWRSALFVILLCLILWGLFRPETTSTRLEIEPLETTIQEMMPAHTTEKPTSRSYITGAVGRPGVYSLPQGSILQDLVMAAGGFVQGAQEDAVNLAVEISDQGHYHIPSLDENPQTAVQGSLQTDISQTGLVNLNTAGLAELQTLNGIGPSLAQRILDWRDNYGPFKAKDELMLVPGIKEAKYSALEQQLASIP